MQAGNYQNMMDNSHYTNISALQIRLDTDQSIEKIEKFLRGQMTIARRDEAGEIVMEKIQLGKPMANEEGIQSILNLVIATLNTQTVQGNFLTEEMYWNYVTPFEISLNRNIMANLYKWEIEVKDFVMIIDTIMSFVVPFMTRLINNGERESYNNTMRISETNTMRDSTRKLNPFRQGD